MSNLTRSFNYGRDADLVQTALRVAKCMKDNPDFPAPPHTVAVLEQAIADFQLALTNAIGRDKVLVAVKNDKRVALRSVLSQLADYVSSVALGDLTKLIQSGFNTARSRGGSVLEPIVRLVVKADVEGQAITSIAKVYGARNYIHEYTTDPMMAEGSWKGRITTDREVVFNELTAGVKYWFRVKAVGMKGAVVISPVVARYIL